MFSKKIWKKNKKSIDEEIHHNLLHLELRRTKQPRSCWLLRSLRLRAWLFLSFFLDSLDLIEQDEWIPNIQTRLREGSFWASSSNLVARQERTISSENELMSEKETNISMPVWERVWLEGAGWEKKCECLIIEYIEDRTPLAAFLFFPYSLASRSESGDKIRGEEDWKKKKKSFIHFSSISRTHLRLWLCLCLWNERMEWDGMEYIDKQ